MSLFAIFFLEQEIIKSRTWGKNIQYVFRGVLSCPNNDKVFFYLKLCWFRCVIWLQDSGSHGRGYNVCSHNFGDSYLLQT